MRKIILGVAMSLDGLIEGPNGEYDWCFTDQDYGMKNFLKQIDTILYGRKSYEVAGGNIFPKKQGIVFSSTLTRVNAGDQLVGKDTIGHIRQMKSMEGKDMWLFGGASLTASLMEANLVDELWLSVHPVLLGSGKALFANLPGRVTTRLLTSKTYNTGLVSLRYEVVTT